MPDKRALRGAFVITPTLRFKYETNLQQNVIQSTALFTGKDRRCIDLWENTLCLERLG